MIYKLFKAFIDPVFIIFILMLIGLWLAGRKGAARLFKFNVFMLVVLFTLTTPLLPDALTFFLEKDFFLSQAYEDIDVVVVLGAGSYSDASLTVRPSSETALRLVEGLKLFAVSKARFIVFCGKGTGKTSEAELMAQAALLLGCPAQNILIDPTSENTWQHPERVLALVGDKKLKIGLVTSAYHMRRSIFEFVKIFPDVRPYPSDFLYRKTRQGFYLFMPSTVNLYRLYSVSRELAGIAWYRVKR